MITLSDPKVDVVALFGRFKEYICFIFSYRDIVDKTFSVDWLYGWGKLVGFDDGFVSELAEVWVVLGFIIVSRDPNHFYTNCFKVLK